MAKMSDSRSSSSGKRPPCLPSSHPLNWTFQWLLLLSTLALASAALPGGKKEVKAFDPSDDSSLITYFPAYTVLFPWFTQMLGVVLFFLLCKFECPVPFAAIMFLVGAACGIGSTLRYEDQGNDELDQLSISVLQWSNIDSSVLLLVFLPGLIFRDAIEVNFHLFYKSLSQLLLLAFPLVLVGAALTAGIGKYVLINTKYGDWPISLWMVLGSILASTDPIAVGSVLRKLGAPPRLQMHICGESLINDGSALVFYVIFTQQYIADLHLADGISLGEGIALFCRLALGGTVVGIAFALGLCAMLHVMDTRLEPEYNIVQVVAALATAYLSYYVSEQVCAMSGIIACVVCGITVRGIGKGLIREHHLMDSYLALMEHLLNALLFTLGGVVWGKAVVEGNVTALDWIYLLSFYMLVMIIRCIQIAMFYPVFCRIGIKSDWKEATFLAYGGIRGAVGVALALALNGAVLSLTDDPDTKSAIRALEFLAGGVTLLTLSINGTFAGPLLRRLGLTKPVVSRKQAIRLFESSAKLFVKDEYTKLMAQERFTNVKFHIVKGHVPFTSKIFPKRRRLGPITESQRWNGRAESERIRQVSSESERPNTALTESERLGSDPGGASEDLDALIHRSMGVGFTNRVRNTRSVSSTAISVAESIDDEEDPLRNSQHMTRMISVRSANGEEQLVELRQLFWELLKQAYCTEDAQGGAVDDREENDGLNLDLLKQSVEIASSDHQTPMHDWKFARYEEGPVSMIQWFHNLMMTNEERERSMDYQRKRNTVLRCSAFVEAHKEAERQLKSLSSSASRTNNFFAVEEPPSVSTAIDVDEPEKPVPSRRGFDVAIETVLRESASQVAEAQAVLEAIPQSEIVRITSHYMCTVLLRRLTTFVEKNVADGILTKKEAMLYYKQIDRGVEQTYTCTHSHSNESDIRGMIDGKSGGRTREDPSEVLATVMNAYLYRK